ncbi:hypothetical protein ACFVTC_17825 [Streptomyces sp. NPDC057950]|uniref:hypothetical protein n=1 Tax=Streptomyces sp. NPDC057950 TaxID=3346288 RepID=UPI0036E9BD88
MNSNRTARRLVRRTALTAGLVAAVTLPLGLSASAQASAPASAKVSAVAPRSVSGTFGRAVTRVADFYGAYIDAKGDYEDPDGTLATVLREHYLTPDFNRRLEMWEEENGADGVLRVQNVPARWTVTDNGAVGNGHEVVVTLTFGSGATTQKTKLFVLLERYDHIVDIGTTSGH